MQWIKVSSKSKIIVCLWVFGRGLRWTVAGGCLLEFFIYCKISIEVVKWFLQRLSKDVGFWFEKAFNTAET